MNKIVNPGIYEMTMREYVADPCREISLHSSMAGTMLSKTPFHAWRKSKRLNNDAEETAAEAALMGSALHEVVLCRNWEKIVRVEFDSWRTKEARTSRNKLLDAKKIPILAKKFDELEEIAEIVSSTAAKNKHLNQNKRGKAEQTIIWKESAEFLTDQRECSREIYLRSRPDWLADDHSLIVSYKTTSNAEPQHYMRQILVQEGYDLQAEFECSGIETLFGLRPKYIWIVQETKAPFACSFLEHTEISAQIGRERKQCAVNMFAKCMHEQNWPSYPVETISAIPPAYLFTQWEERKIMLRYDSLFNV